MALVRLPLSFEQLRTDDLHKSSNAATLRSRLIYIYADPQDFGAGVCAGAAQLVVGHPFGDILLQCTSTETLITLTNLLIVRRHYQGIVLSLTGFNI